MDISDLTNKATLFSDFQIHVGSTIYYVHKVILAQSSEYFKKLLTNNMIESQNNIIQFDKDVYEYTLPLILYYIYNRIIFIAKTSKKFLLIFSTSKFNSPRHFPFLLRSIKAMACAMNAIAV